MSELSAVQVQSDLRGPAQSPGGGVHHQEVHGLAGVARGEAGVPMEERVQHPEQTSRG